MKLHPVCTLAALFVLPCSSLLAASFAQTNLVSDGVVPALTTDVNLKDAWGMSFSPGTTPGTGSPIWVSDRDTGVSTLYSGSGVKANLTVNVPPGAPNGPTGQVFAGGTTFRLNNSPVNFIFDTLGGTIDAWNGGAGMTAVIMVTAAVSNNANYTGLALANNTLYAANFKTGGGIDVYDSTFAPTTVSGHFTDTTLPAGYAPFNVQNINGILYVEYAKVTNGVPVSQPGGGGYVDEFDSNGVLIKRLVSNGPLNGPWGVAVVPGSGFGQFASGDVLIGNFNGDDIDVFDPNGNFLQTLTDINGNSLKNGGLWALAFDPNAPGTTDTGALYFTAGPNMGNDGIFGKIDAVPEPGTWALAILGVLGAMSFRRAVKREGQR